MTAALDENEQKEPADAVNRDEPPPALEPGEDPWARVPPAVRESVRFHMNTVREILDAVEANYQQKGPHHADLELRDRRERLDAAMGRLADFLATEKGIPVAPELDALEQQVAAMMAGAEGTPPAPPVR